MSTTPNQKDLLAKKSDLEGILKPDDNDVLHLPGVTITLAESGQFYLAGIDKKLLTLVGNTSGNAVTLDGDAGLTFTTSGGSSTITGITSSNGNSTSLAASQSMASAKQDKIVAGSNITIAQDGKTISATDTTYSTFNGASASADGSTGLVPKPFIADKDKYLRGDGTWQTIQATPALNDLTDVDLTTPTDGQILKYDATNQEWINANENPGVTTISGLTDVDVTTTTPTNGQGLVYNSTSQKWENANVLASASVSTLTDVNLTSLKNGQVLKYNTSTQKWVNAEDIDETNEFGPNAPTASIGKDGQIYMQYVGNPTATTYYTVWTGMALSTYQDQPVKVEGFNPSKYYKIRITGVSYDTNINEEKLVSEIPETSIYSGAWHVGERMYVSTRNNGTELWVYNYPSHPTYPSYITRISATAPSEINKVYGKIANNWIEFPGGSGSSTLADLSDVDITTPTDGQGLVYNNTTQKWENGNVSSASSIDTLTDVNLTNLTNGQILKYNSTSQEWENANESGGGGGSALSDLTDVTVTSPSDGQVLTYDNTSGKWVNDTPTASSSISSLTDVNLTSLSDGQILKYDATNDEWVNADESGGGGGTSKYTEEVLWSGNESTSRWVEPVVLNIDITDYDMLSIRCGATNEAGGVHIILTSEIPSGSSSGDGTVSLGTFTDSQYSIWLNKDDNILRIFTSTGVSINVKEVVGIKYGSGGGGGSGGVDTLWTGDVCPYVNGVTDITLNHSHTDYDYILVNTYDTNYNMHGTSIFYDLKTNYNYEDTIDSQGDVRNILLFQVLGDTSIRLKNYGQLGQCTHFTGFYGVKTGGGGSSVTPNPTDPATDALTSIEIDGTVYSVGGGDASAEEITLSDYNALTTEEKNDGTIRFIPKSNIGYGLDIDFTNSTAYKESGMSGTTVNNNSVQIVWDITNIYCGLTIYPTVKVDVTNYDYISYDFTSTNSYDSLHPGSENPVRDLGIGLKSTAPSAMTLAPNIDYTIWNRYEVTDVGTTFTDERIDVSNLTGEYYLIIACAGWNATVSNIVIGTEGGNPSQIKYMDKTYGIGEDGEGYTEEVIYSATPTTAAPSTLTLTKPYTDFDMLLFNLYRSADGVMNKYDRVVLTSKLSLNDRIQLITYNEWASYDITNATTLTLVNSNSMYIGSVVGLKFGEGGGSGGSSEVTYSTTEHKVGTWIDGSDVYEKTIILRENGTDNFTYTSSVFEQSLPANIDWINIESFYAKRASGGWVDCMNNQQETILVPNPTTQGIYFYSQMSHTDVTVTIRYTKTT